MPLLLLWTFGLDERCLRRVSDDERSMVGERRRVGSSGRLNSSLPT